MASKFRYFSVCYSQTHFAIRKKYVPLSPYIYPSYSINLIARASPVTPLMEFMIMASVLLFCIFTIFLYKRTGVLKSNNPPSPPKLPFIGNLHQLGSLLHRSLHTLSQKHGQIMLVHFGHVPTLVLSSADMALEVMKVQDLNFASRPPSTMAKRLLYNSQDVAFSPYGEYWRHVKKICVLQLLSIKRVQSFSNIRREEVKLMLERIRSGPQLVNVSETVTGFTNDMVCRVAFGRKFNCDGGAMEVLAEFSALFGEFTVSDFFPWWFSWLDRVRGLEARVADNFHRLDAFIAEVIEDHVQREGLKVGNEETMDFVDVLLSIEKDDISLTRDNIKALVLDMYVGGTHTTFTALEWTMAELIRHPEAMKKVQNEVRSIVGLKQNIEEGDLDQMNYMRSVIKETLRLHPPTPLLVPRESMKDTELMGYHIPSKTRVIINAWSIGRDPKSWERPEEFLPDRFMNSSVDFRGQHFHFIPFGAGRRRCPGVDFAVATIELALANLLFHFNWVLPDGKGGESLDMSETSGITSHMKYGLVLEATPF